MDKVKVLLDTNIVLDFFSGRMNDGCAATLVQIGRSGQYEMCISFLTAINTIYVARRMGATVVPADLPHYFTILPQNFEQWTEASHVDMADFEDALQTVCALRNQCFIAISRDRHFDSSPMSVLTPERFIELVCKQ